MTVARFLNHSLAAILKSHGRMEGANPTCRKAVLLGDSRFKAGAGSRRAGAGSRCILILIRVHFERLVGILEGA